MDPKGVTESVMARSSKRECVGKRKGKTRGERGEALSINDNTGKSWERR